jgi:hypothetical protein
MKISRGIILILALVIAGSVFHSCKKEKESTTPAAKTSATWVADDALAQKTYDDVQGIANEAWSKSSKSPLFDTVFLSSCATITLELNVMPYRLTVDFGSTNCLCPDNKYRRGKIIVTFNGAYADSGTVIRDSLDNYYVDNNKVEGTRVVTNLGYNGAGHLHYRVTVNGSIIKPNNEGTITWHHDGEREWIAGENTWTWLDDEYLISGTSSGVAANGQSYSLTTVTPLDIKLNCHYICGGILNFQGEGLPLITVDYGNGTCDNVATATFLGQTITIYM